MNHKRIYKLGSTKFRDFCKHCSLHGFYYLGGEPRRFVRCVWAAVICASLVLCTVLSSMIWSKFVRDPTLTVVESVHYPTEDIPFPAVTVCDVQIHGPATTNITHILTERGFTALQIEDFYRSVRNIRSDSSDQGSHVTRMHDTLENMGLSYSKLLYQLKKPCNELLKECSWRSKQMNCSTMFREVLTVFGHCCQFDINYFKQLADNDTNLVGGVPQSEALDILVNSKTLLPNGTFIDGHIELYIFDQLNRLTLLDSSIVLTSSTSYDVTVDLWIIDASLDVKNLALNKRKCFMETDPEYFTSYQSCVANFMMREIADTCHCLPFDYKPQESQYTQCKWERQPCIQEALGNVQGEVRRILSQHECYQKCDYVQYETKAEYTRVRGRRGVDNNEAESGLTRVAVHYTDTICIKYRREVLYTWDQMLANLGGIFGLCLGGSIISIIEIVWFLFDLLGGALCRLRNKNKKDNKIFTVNDAYIKNHEKLRYRPPLYPFVN